LDVFRTGAGDPVNAASCKWADQVLPARSFVATREMSGALKFYTERLIVRWDTTDPEQWPQLKSRAAEKGYQWYALLLPVEVEEAQKRLSGKWVQMGALNQVSLWRIEPSSN